MDGAFPSSLGEGEGDKRRGFRGTQENAKTKMCLRWKSGHCRFGDACNFAHGEEELRQLPPRSSSGGRGRGGYGLDQGFSQSYGSSPQHVEQGSYYPRGGGAEVGSRGGPTGVSQGKGPSTFGGESPGAARPASNNDIWAAQGYPVQGPNGWTQYQTLDTREAYYHNHISGKTVWDKPADWR